MEITLRQPSFWQKKMTKQLTGKRDDTHLHSAVREGELEVVLGIVSSFEDRELKELMSKQNQSGETALYVAAECGYVDLVKELMKYHDTRCAAIKARNGYDAFHIASKQGNIEIVRVLADAIPELSMTVDSSNVTALHSAASQGHVNIVNFLLENTSSLATIARSNGKTALHSAARNGHVEAVKALLSKVPGIAIRIDKKGQTALHMAVKGQNVEVVDELAKSDSSLINMIDTKGNAALHIAARKGRSLIVHKLLNYEGIDKTIVNKSGETALDTAKKSGQTETVSILQEHGVQLAKSGKPSATSGSRELKQTVSDIKHEVHDQLHHTRKTRKRCQHITKQLNKMHSEGLNNAINSTTVVAVLIATVAFAAIFTLPGQFVDKASDIPPGYLLGEANIANNVEFVVFFITDSIALFISLAVVVVQTSVVVIERKAKKQLMAIINKLMWIACIMVSVAFISLSYIVVGANEKWLAIAVTVIGTVIMVATLGTMCYWVIGHRIEASKMRRSSLSCRSRSGTMSVMSDTDILNNEFKKVYAV